MTPTESALPWLITGLAGLAGIAALFLIIANLPQ